MPLKSALPFTSPAKLLSVLLAFLSLAMPARAQGTWASLLKSAQAGNVSAQKAVAYAYARGEWVPANLPEAIAWYKMAAKRGDAAACFQLGMIYRFRTVAIDYEILERLFADAAAKGDALAQYKMGLAVRMNAKSMGQIRSSELASVEWLKQAANQGQPDAQAELGRLYAEGTLVIEKDPALAAQWLRKAAEKNPEAMYRLAKAYTNGDGVLKNPATSAKWLQRAAEAGHAQAQLEFSLVLTDGVGVPANQAEADKWGRLADEPRPPGPLFTADQYFSMSAKPEPLDVVESHAWFNLASSRGYQPPELGGITPQIAMSVLELEMSEEQKGKAPDLAEALLAELNKP